MLVPCCVRNCEFACRSFAEMAFSARGRVNSSAVLSESGPNAAPIRPSTAQSANGSVRSTASSVRQALATYKHASRVSGLPAADIVSRGDQADALRMKTGKNHSWRRTRRDFLPEIPTGENAAMKKRTTRTQARHKMA